MNATEEQVENEVIVTTTKPAPSKAAASPQVKRQPLYSVIVLDDDLHAFDYVIEVLCRICGHSPETALRLTIEIDSTGKAVVWTGVLEVAELKRDQIRGFGPDMYGPAPVTFPLGCYIEPIV